MLSVTRKYQNRGKTRIRVLLNKTETVRNKDAIKTWDQVTGSYPNQNAILY